eukprot:2810383-Alexandrium_andersonii.AAC.1
MSATRACWQRAESRGGPNSYKGTSGAAPWSRQLISSGEFLKSLCEAGVRPPAIFGRRGFMADTCLAGWLRAVGLGIGADLLGN